jgi:hypothetical protein
MKIQDIIFTIVFLITLLKRNSTISIIAGLFCLFLSIPLFALWVFFTAEHLVWYAAGFFLLSIILLFLQ